MDFNLIRSKVNMWSVGLLVIFVLHVFLRFYHIEERLLFGWDQVRDAWVMRGILHEGILPVLGPVAKYSAFKIGAAYYYLLLPFYFIFSLNPIAGGVFAGVVSVLTSLVLFVVTRRVFNIRVALISMFIHAVSINIYNLDRLAWNAGLISSVSLVIYYSLYNISKGDLRYIPILALVAGFAFHVHFTALFFVIIATLFFVTIPMSKKLLKYLLLSFPLFLMWFLPHFISDLTASSHQSQSVFNYIGNSYHGLHLKRVLQLATDAFIQFEIVLPFQAVRFLKYFLFLAFIGLVLLKKSNNARHLVFLTTLWFVVPWFVFSVYSGEISAYYFLLTRPIVIMILGALTVWLLEQRYMVVKLGIISFWLVYAVVNMFVFFQIPISDYLTDVNQTKNAIASGNEIEFSEGNAKSYLYYIHTYAAGK